MGLLFAPEFMATKKGVCVSHLAKVEVIFKFLLFIPFLIRMCRRKVSAANKGLLIDKA